MIPMKAPAEDVTAFSYNGTQYPVTNGVLEVPPEAVRHAVAHGFLLNTSDNAGEQTKYDVEAAISKALAAVEVAMVVMRAPEDVTAACVEGEQFDVENGNVTVPKSAEAHLKRQGFTTVEVPELRTDGPTLTEYVKAGYSADGYPPKGYADKRTAEELEAAAKAAAEATDMNELLRKKVPELRAWLKKRNVDVLDPRATKDQLLAMIADTMKAEAAEAKAKEAAEAEAKAKAEAGS